MLLASWYVIYLLVSPGPQTPIFTIGPFPDSNSCNYTKEQIEKQFRPKKIGCMDAPHIGERASPPAPER